MSNFFPLSKSEEGLYISSLSGGDAYNLANTVNLGKDVGVDQVNAALNKVFEAHPYLFTVLSSSDSGEIVKHIEKEELKVEVEEVRELNIVSLPYELLDKHLYRFKLYKVGGDNIFYFDFHHILMDGTSIKIFIDDFFLALEGKELELEKSDANDFALKEKEQLQSKEYEKAKKYYEVLLGDVEIDSTLTDDKADKEISYSNIRKELDLI